MRKRTRSELLDDLQHLRGNQLALTERLQRILTAMAMSEEASAHLYQRLDALDDPPNGYRHAALVASEAAHTYRQFLSNFTEPVDAP